MEFTRVLKMVIWRNLLAFPLCPKSHMSACLLTLFSYHCCSLIPAISWPLHELLSPQTGRLSCPFTACLAPTLPLSVACILQKHSRSSSNRPHLSFNPCTAMVPFLNFLHSKSYHFVGYKLYRDIDTHFKWTTQWFLASTQSCKIIPTISSRIFSLPYKAALCWLAPIHWYFISRTLFKRAVNNILTSLKFIYIFKSVVYIV